MKKRGQITMESLLLYGAAILVVLLAIAALTYFGVLDMGKWLPQTCNLEGTGILSCEEFLVSASADNDIQITVKNTGTKTLDISASQFVADDSALADTCTDSNTIDNLLPGSMDVIEINCTGGFAASAGDRLKGTVEITHKFEGGTLDMVTSGTLTATVTE